MYVSILKFFFSRGIDNYHDSLRSIFISQWSNGAAFILLGQVRPKSIDCRAAETDFRSLQPCLHKK